jgi:hypothetical protein
MAVLSLVALCVVAGSVIYGRTHEVAVPTPVPSSTTVTTTTTTAPAECLCIFDIDRTLTGKQQEVARCPKNLIQEGVEDSAYTRGLLTLSHLSQALKDTFCSKCYLGSISQGDATSDVEREILYNSLDVDQAGHPLPENSQAWGAGCATEGKPLMTQCPDGHKQEAVPHILQYYRDAAGVNITDEQVFFFDDRKENIDSFRDTKYNAKQISCESRDDGGIGLCGATVDEIARFSGFSICDAAAEPVSV